MTREEALYWLDTIPTIGEQVDALDMAIKALEQEPILDKIRAEINELYSYVEFDEDIKTSFNMVRLEDVQRVIDKYKAESEVSNDKERTRYY